MGNARFPALKKPIALGLLILWGCSACANLPTLSTSQDALSPAEHARLGDAYSAKGENDLAVQQYDAALAKDKRYAPALLGLGTTAYNAKDWRDAEHYFKHVLKLYPNNPSAANNLAMTYLAENAHLQEARAALDGAMGIAGPLIPYLQDTLANVDIQENRWTDAKADIDRAQGTAPTNDPTFAIQLQKTRDRLSDALKASPPKF